MRSGGAVELEYLEDLVDFAVSAEERFLLGELGKDAADGPDVNSQAVLLLSEQNFGGPVPESFNFVGEGFDGEGKGACKSEVSNFEKARAVDEQILRLEVPVDNPPAVAVVDAIAQLVDEQFDLLFGHGMFVLAQVLFQIVLYKFKYQVELLLGGVVFHVLQTG